MNLKTINKHSLINPFIETEYDIHTIMTSQSSCNSLIPLLGKLSKHQMRLILYIMFEVKDDVIVLDYNHLKKRFNVCSNTTINNDLKSLEEINLIRKKEKGKYWINPFILMKQDLKFYYKDLLKGFVRANFSKLYLTYYEN